ncbi:MAG: cell envelope integrity protein CreD, partial [Prolixibacteraceae bacterium]|nr:cell envelope integrity protein CreD [Prolixibacteraceae bacterium]
MEKENQGNILDRMGLNFHRKLSFKLFTIGFLVLVLMIPKLMILSLISERSLTADEASSEVMSKWSDNQEITGPVLTVPYTKSVYNERNKEYKEVIHTATFLPKELNINGKINPKKLYRSIYDVIVYESDINLSGNFELPDFSDFNIDEKDIQWKDAQILLAINDLRGINEEVILKWNNSGTTFAPGINKSVIGESGISVSLPNISADNFRGNFQISLKLKGSQSLMFTPVGEKTEVHLESPW